jgi:transcriptional regulator
LNSPEEWFDAITISGCDQELLRFIEEDTGEFTSEVMQEVEAVVLVQSNGELRI